MVALEHFAHCQPEVGCPVCTCPDCGVIGQPFVCGSPDDPSGGADCEAREARAWAERAVEAARRAKAQP